MRGHGKRASGRRVSRSLPLSEKSWRRLPVGSGVGYGKKRWQTRLDRYSQQLSQALLFRNGKERRRQARDSSAMGSPSNHNPLSTEPKDSLAMAAVTMATGELDRLSEMARRHDAGA
jgi:hypothetical protein